MSAFVYRGERTRELSFPLGGIGTGCIGLTGNGRLMDWEIFNRPNKGSLNGFSHFAIRAERGGKVLDARVLQGDMLPPYQGELGGGPVSGHGPGRENMAGAPHFREAVFRGEFPIAELDFRGTRFPGRVSLTAFNPFIPLNDRDSGIPAAFFEIAVRNTTKQALTYTVFGVLTNPLAANNRNRVTSAGGLTALHLASDAHPDSAPEYGNLTLATDARDAGGQAYWFKGRWFDNLEVYWREMMEPGRPKPRTYSPKDAGNGTTGMLGAQLRVAPGRTARVRFVISWSFPNFQKYWGGDAGLTADRDGKVRRPTWKNYYATLWTDSRASARYALHHWDRLERETRRFKDALFASDLPEAALEAVSANLAVLKSPTVLRLEDGTLYGWEGCTPDYGCCEGSCTHVWNYAQAIPFLFPKLERSMRTANYRHNQDPDGGMHFRLQLPLGAPYSSFRPCADGQFGDVIKTYRDWKISGDTDWLRALWPKIRKSIEYAWSPNNPDRWDPDKTGVLQGRQHHTLDMELFGPNSWLTGYYLAALKAAAEMADRLGEDEFAKDLRALFAKGKEWTDTHLFNGEYYHQIVDMKNRAIPGRFGALKDYWNDEHKELKYQIGEGSEIDQIIAQWHANLYGLGEVFDPAQVKKTLRSIYRNNFKKMMREHFNACRLYSLNDEAGLIVCVWPEGKTRPITPLPYAGETQNGYEWAACIQMIQAGLVKEGMTCVKAIRDRYDGARRNPWNEFECGSNYARSMASYSLLNAFSGFAFDMTCSFIGFRPVRTNKGRFRCFWSLDSGWGEFELTPRAAEIRVLSGRLRLREVALPFTPRKVLAAGRAVAFSVTQNGAAFRAVTIHAGKNIRFAQ